jgi:NAD(P)-dependent dehydrogenase (short-subunit alcohol dehydrogenase family)
MAELSGKVALITGGASGIGRATAERLCAEGAHVVVADVDEAGGRAVAQKLDAEFVSLDVSSAARWDEVAAGLRTRHGGIDVAFLNAGITTYPASAEGIAPFDLATLDLERYRRILSINVDGVVLGARAAVPLLEARGGGAIVATASVAGLIGYAPDPIYTLTKHAVVGLVRALAPTLEPRGIRIHAICPGGVDTNILGPGMAERARDLGIAIMPASQIADAVAQAVRSPETGRLWVCLHDRDHQHYHFAPVEGLGEIVAPPPR